MTASPREAPRVRLILASASPARLATLRAAGVEPEVLVSGVPEDDVSGDALTVAGTLAERKARAVAATLAKVPRVLDDVIIVGADSVLELDGEVHGKPADAAEAIARWQRMRGGTGVLHTGHFTLAPTTGAYAAGVASTTVRFADLSDAEIAAYVATGEPLRVAGAFTIDGIGGPFVECVDGDPHNVVGLSLPLLRRLLRDLGVAWPDLW